MVFRSSSREEAGPERRTKTKKANHSKINVKRREIDLQERRIWSSAAFPGRRLSQKGDNSETKQTILVELT